GLLGAVHHVESLDGALAADEHAGALHPFGPTREDRVLHEAGHVFGGDVGVGNRRVEAGVERHVHVERAHMLERCDHVQNAGVPHAKSLPAKAWSASLYHNWRGGKAVTMRRAATASSRCVPDPSRAPHAY